MIGYYRHFDTKELIYVVSCGSNRVTFNNVPVHPNNWGVYFGSKDKNDILANWEYITEEQMKQYKIKIKLKERV